MHPTHPSGLEMSTAVKVGSGGALKLAFLPRLSGSPLSLSSTCVKPPQSKR